MIGTEQHHPLRSLLVHAEHEHLAADRTDLSRRQVDDGDYRAPGELFGVYRSVSRADDRIVPSGPKSMTMR